MKYLFDFTYMFSIVLAILLLCNIEIFSQSNLIIKPAQVIKLTWNPSMDPDVWQYAIFWCQGADTTLFPFNTGTDPDSLWKNEPIWNWSFVTIYGLKYCHIPNDMPGITYLRLGVAGINLIGKYGLIKCISKVIRISKPVSITDVKIY